MPNHPSENTLTVNVTHRQLQSLNPQFSRLVAIAPTRVEEGSHRKAGQDPEGGYDIRLETAKEVVFQHKSPYGMVEHQNTNWLKFNIDTEQCWALAEQYELGQAFLALPIVSSAAELPYCLNLTVFVDVHLVDHYNDPRWMPADGDSISTIYVERSEELANAVKENPNLSTLDNSLAPSVHLKSNSRKWKMNGPAYKEISMENFQTPANDSAIAWAPLAKFIRSCRYGVRIRGGRERRQPVPVKGLLEDFLPEISEEVAPSYRNRIARTRVLAACSGNHQTDMDMEQFTEVITEDIVDRREAMEDFFRLDVDTEAVYDRVRQGIEQFWMDQSRFQRVANRTRRNIIEGGDKSNEITIA